MTVLRRSVTSEIPGPRAREAMKRGAFDMQHGYRALVIDDVASSGVHLVDADGNVLLDLFANFALGALGYNHPALLAVAQSPAFAHAVANPTSTPFVTSNSWFDALERIQRFAPKGMESIYCVDAGGEGVESALKAAFIVRGDCLRQRAGHPANPLEQGEDALKRTMDNEGSDAVVVSFAGAFHGRGLGPLSATHSKPIHKADLPAFPWPTAPYPANRFPLARHAEENARAETAALRDLERLLDAHEGKVAAVLIEPIQSEGGDRHASASFYRGVQTLANAAGAALIMDEVQTGVGMSGALWAHEHFGLSAPPDMVCFGKKMQMGGFFATHAFSIGQFGRMYQTRNGDRARAMLAAATLDTILSEHLLKNVKETGAAFLAGLEALADKHPKLVSEARGKGFLLAFDLPTVAARDDFLKRSLAHGVFASYTGTRSVRLRPHLITTRADVDDALGVFDGVLREMA